MSKNRLLGSIVSEQSQNVSFDNGTLYIDASNNRIGIGTTTPTSNLSVSGTLNVSSTITQGGALGHYAVNIKGAGSIGDSSVYLHLTTLDTGTTNADGAAVGLGIGSSPVMYITNYENAAMAFSTNSSEKMRIASDGNVGIGTSSPVASNKLTIDNGSNSYGLVIQNTGGNDVGFKLAPNGTTQFYFTSNTNGNASMESNGATIFRANNAERARITSTGNMGIGTSSPISKLSIASASDTSDLGTTGLTIGGATTLTSGNVLMLNFTPIGADSNRARAGIGCEVGADWGKGNLTFYTKNLSGAGAMSTSDERMRITSDGYVGIGTTSPLQKVQIVAPSSSGSISTALAFSQGGSGSGTGTSLWLGYGAEDTKSVAISGFYDGAGVTMGFYTASTAASTAFTERMRITNAGAVCIGHTSAAGGANVPSLTVKSSSAADQCVNLWNSGTSGTRWYMYFGTGSTFTATGSITTDGSTTSYTTTSDYRLKENIQPMTNALSRIMSLKPCTYQWKSNGDYAEGFIAHELAEVCPQAVTGIKDDVKIIETVDEQGNTVQQEVPVYQGVDSSFLIACLVSAIQELKTEFDLYKQNHA